MSITDVQSQGEVVGKPDRARAEKKSVTLRATALSSIAPLASLRLTVLLLSLSMLLIFFGTLAQVDSGIWTVVDQYFWSVWVWVPFRLVVKFGQIFFNVSPNYTADPNLGFPLLGGFSLGWLLFFNLIAAHLVRFKLSWKRTGIILVHGGLILLLVGEFITRKYAAEGTMTILEGASSNFVLDQRKAELAVIDSSKPELDEVTAIPQSMLKRDAKIQDKQLPFDITVREFFPNSKVEEPDDWANNPTNKATAGHGKRLQAVATPVISGAASDQKVDLPSAYISISGRSGEDLGTFLVSTWLTEVNDIPDQTITIDEKPYKLLLRFKRKYKPYTIQLNDFKHDVYIGTDTPKNFQSDIRLIDKEIGVDRVTSIRMNEPMRHRGETFYQSSFLPGDRGTVLQVVRNPGWLLPYFSCILVGVGMILQFTQHLFSFEKNLSSRRVA